MSIVDNQQSWVGIVNGDKCANCYYFGNICLNCSDVQSDTDTDYDLKFGLMTFEEFKESAIFDFIDFTYEDFRSLVSKGNPYEVESHDDNYLSNGADFGEVSESD